MQNDYVFVGKSRFVTEELPLLLEKLGPLSDTVVVQGETGTGKSVVVAMINEYGARQGAMLTFNCAATPPELFESELFGYQKGAYTGAAEKAQGAIAVAGTGTLCLDEIGEVPLACQQKLLRVFDGWYKPLGIQKELAVEARILATTNRDLEAMVKEQKFRLDLFHRLHVHVITIPPLRDRRTDIRPLLEHFVEISPQNKHGQIDLEVDAESFFQLTNYPWPGNVRELRNAVARALVHRKNNGTVSTLDILTQVVPRSAKAAKVEQVEERPTEHDAEPEQVSVSVGARSSLDPTQERVARLQKRNLELVREVNSLRQRVEELEAGNGINQARSGER